MCGIFGYVGEKTNVGEMVFDGLKLLEYRGYDSWGIAVKEESVIKVEKNIGKIGDAKVKFNQSTIGIGHTRWATHGGVTVKNAHPHLDCHNQIAVIHNGIVENYQEIKKELIKKGHKFISETDTEVIPHLIEENLKKEGFATSFRDAFNTLAGMNAVVAMYTVSSEIIAAKSGSPLIIGQSDKGFYVSSDPSGIIPHTRNLLFVRDQEMVILGKKIQLLKLPKGNKIKPVFEKIDWKINTADKGKYKHFMIKEIYDEPKVIRNISENYTDQILKLSGLISKAHGTFFIGSGTASFACLSATYLFSKISKKHVNTIPASEFNYLEDFLTSKSLIIALSQSGETIDVVEPIQRAQKRGTKIVGITNVLGSTIYRISDYKILLGAGPERAVASTKAFIAKISMVLLLSFAISNKLKIGKQILNKSAIEIDRILKDSSLSKIKKLSVLLKQCENIYIIGRGFSYASALEGALKIKEVSYIHAEGLAGGELKHGSIALISKGTPCIVFAPNDETYSAIISNATEIKARGGYIIGVSEKNDPIFDFHIEVRGQAEVQYIAQNVPLQILAYYLAVERGLDPDKPRNLAKSVTVK